MIDHVCSSIECVRSACGPSESLDAPSICLFVFLYVGSYLLIYEFESWITGVCSSYVVSLCDFAYYIFGYEPAIAMHLSLWYVVLVCHQYDVCENSVCSV